MFCLKQKYVTCWSKTWLMEIEKWKEKEERMQREREGQKERERRFENRKVERERERCQRCESKFHVASYSWKETFRERERERERDFSLNTHLHYLHFWFTFSTKSIFTFFLFFILFLPLLLSSSVFFFWGLLHLVIRFFLHFFTSSFASFFIPSPSRLLNVSCVTRISRWMESSLQEPFFFSPFSLFPSDVFFFRLLMTSKISEGKKIYNRKIWKSERERIEWHF